MSKTVTLVAMSLSLTMLLGGCGLAYRVLLGVDSTPDWQTDSEITKQAKRYQIPAESLLVLDTVVYFKGLGDIYANLFSELSQSDSSEYSRLKRAYKDDAQPVHFRLFDNRGTELFKLVNCYVDPPVRMIWNVEGCFDKFPPATEIESLNVHSFDLSFLLVNSRTLDNKKMNIDDLPVADYYGVILWNDFFHRPSGKLIKTIREYLADSETTISMVYINNQNAYLWQIMDSHTKEEIKRVNNLKDN